MRMNVCLRLSTTCVHKLELGLARVEEKRGDSPPLND